MTVPPPGESGRDRSGLISGRYRLGELLGSGGSASVFTAVDVATGEAVALKILHPHLSRSPAARDAFFVEARAAERLLHPNIVRVLGVGVHRVGEDPGAADPADPADPLEPAADDSAGEPRAWIALELAPGTTLAEEVERVGRLPLAEAVAVAEGVLAALEFAHGAGLIHRDVSPTNVVLARDPRGRLRPSGVRLLDFGLADAAGRAAVGADVLRTPGASAPAGVLGNANYVSPEHARGLPVDERGDIYQLGATLYFALIGRPPFVRDSTAATLAAHLEAPPPVPSVDRPGVFRALDRIVVKALLKDPTQRYASAAEMSIAVRAAAARLAATAEGDGGMVRLDTVSPSLPSHGSGDAGSDGATLVFGAAVASTTTAAHTASRGASARILPAPPPAGPSAPDAVTTALPTARSRRQAGPSAGAAVRGVAVGAGRASVAPARTIAIGSARPQPIGGSAGVGALPRGGALALWLTIGAVLVVLVAAWALAAGSASPAPFAAPPATAGPLPTPTPSAPPAPVQPVSVPLRAVPALVSGSVESAQAALASAGLALGTVTQESSSRPAGTVLRADPAEGSQLAEGAVVNLVVASGSNLAPDLGGVEQAAAQERLRAEGFTSATSFAASSSAGAARPGTVVGSIPAAGTVLPLGSTITLLIAPAPVATATPAPTAVPTSVPTPPSTSTPEPTSDRTPPPNAG
jgi:serine/threonine-protein kinase